MSAFGTAATVALCALLATGSLAAAAIAPSDPGANDSDGIRPAWQPELRGSANVKNLDTLDEFATIQAAIDDIDTDNGHVLEMLVASHTEGPVTVSKELTLNGALGGTTILAAIDTGSSGDARGWFLLTAPNFTCSNIDFDGDGNKIWQGFRIKSTAGDASFDECSFTDMQFDASGPSYAGNAIVAIDCNMSVTNCTFSDIGRHGIFFFGTGSTAGVASGNTYTGKGLGDWLDYGVELGGGAVATLSNNIFTDCLGVASTDGSGSAAIIATTFFGGGTTAILGGNSMSGNSGGLALGYDGSDTTVLDATDNDFSGNADYSIFGTSTTVTGDASGNWWGSNDPGVFGPSLFGDVDYTPWLDVGTDVGGDPSDGFQGDFATLHVNDVSPQAAAGGRINEGISMVTASTVLVAAGTYVEQVIIDGIDVTVTGDGEATTFIHSPAVLASTFTTSADNRPVVTIKNTAASTISGFTIDGLGVGNANVRFSGVAFWNAGGTLLDCTVKGIRNSPLDGSQHGVGVYAFNDTSGPYAIEVGGCTVFDFQKNAMALSGDGLTVDVHDCTTTGAGDISVTAQNGIQVSFGAGGSVTDCTIEDIRYVPATYVASGLLAYAGTTLTTSGSNLITDVQAPVSWYDTNGTCGGMTIPSGGEFGSIFVYNSTTSLVPESSVRALPQPWVEDYNPSDESRPAQAVAVTDGVLTGSSVVGSSGIYAYGPSQPLAITVTDTDISAWDYGIVLDGPGIAAEIHENSITGNLTAGLDNSLSGNAANATCNWWGTDDGPNVTPENPSTGDIATGGSITYAPWLDGPSGVCASYGANNAFADSKDGPCYTGACIEVPVVFDRTDTSDLRLTHVTFQLSSELELCDTTPAGFDSNFLMIPEDGTWLYDGFANMNRQVLDNGGGSYTVDQTLVGLPCGIPDTGEKTLLKVRVKASGTAAPEDVGTITVTEFTVRGCANEFLAGIPGPPGEITLDVVAPIAVTDLSAGQVKSGNGITGVTAVDLTFAVPVAVDYDETEIYRKGFGSYPEYDDLGGAAPATPGYPPAGWTLAGTSDDGTFTDAPPTRDFWYYAAFSKDVCGNVSAVSNVTGGTLNYHLGDVTTGAGDNDVDGLDISELGTAYGTVDGDTFYNNVADVGPTSDYSVDALPTTDDTINFEDLIMFAINFGLVSRTNETEVPTVTETPTLSLTVSPVDAGGVRTARLVLGSHASAVKGIHSVIQFDARELTLLDVAEGELLGSTGAPIFFKSLDLEQGVAVDMAALGHGTTLSGSGEVAVLRFRAIKAGAEPRLLVADLRDGFNQRFETVDSGSPSDAPAPTALQLIGASPNPFAASTDIAFRLSDATDVRVQVFDVTGRLVRTLLQRGLPAGEHVVTWDGRTSTGRTVAAGMYFYTFNAGGVGDTKKLFRTR